MHGIRTRLKILFPFERQSYSACTRVHTYTHARKNTHKLSFNVQIAWKTKSFVVNDQMARQVVELDPLTGRTIALTRTLPSPSPTLFIFIFFATSHLSGSKSWTHRFMYISCENRKKGRKREKQEKNFLTWIRKLISNPEIKRNLILFI